MNNLGYINNIKLFVSNKIKICNYEINPKNIITISKERVGCYLCTASYA